MRKSITVFIILALIPLPILSQNINLNPVRGKMSCNVRVNDFPGQSFALGIPETIGSSEGMILNFPEVDISWSGPDRSGVCEHTWTSDAKIEYTARLIPHDDYVDVEMTIKNISRNNWTNVFSFNCLNPVAAEEFQDWNLERTYMSKNGNPFRMDSTTRINDGNMKTVQFYLHENYLNVSPFVKGFKATSPDKTDDTYIVTMSSDGSSYMAATSPNALFLFDNLDRCCIHSATDFGDIPSGGERTVTSRFYFAKGSLDDFLSRYESEVKKQNEDEPSLLMCWGNPWALTDTTLWQNVYNNLDILKIYIGNIDARVDPEDARSFIESLLKEDIKIAVELGGLLDWHADKGNRAGESSFQQDYNNVKPLIDLIKEIDPERNIDMLDMDGPIRRMLFPNNEKSDIHTITSAVDELFEVVGWWRDSIPGIEINLLTNFPNWGWGDTPAYVEKGRNPDGYGEYQDVIAAVRAKMEETGTKLDGITIDNPYNYALGLANSNQPDLIRDVDWFERIAELAEETREMGLNVNMIFNTNSGRTAQGYSEQTLELIDLYHEKVGRPDGYWIQSWYQLPGEWLPETEPYTMTNLTLEAMKKIRNEDEPEPEPEDDYYWGIRNIKTNLPEEKYNELNAQLYAWGFSWDRLENPDDTFNWSYLDQAVDFTAAHNGTMVLLLTPSSSWATDGEPRAPNDLDRRTPLTEPIPEQGFSEILYDYTHKIIDHAAKRDPSTLGYLRYGNEPQYADHWQISNDTYEQDVEDFIRCLRTVYKAAHDAADENGVDIRVSHGGFYYDKQMLREWFEIGEREPRKRDSIIKLYYSRYERHWKNEISTWEDFGRLLTNRSGMPNTYWMDVMAGQTDWLDWFDVHYHWKPRFIFDELAAFEKAVIDSGGTIKPWLAAEAAMQIEAAGNTRYESRFHAADMVRKWTLGMAFGLKGICTPIVGWPPDRFFGLYSEDLEEYLSFRSYSFLHSLIQPQNPPVDLSGENVFYYRFDEEIGIVDVVWADALFDTSIVEYPIPQNPPEGYESGIIYDILGNEIHTFYGGFREVQAVQEPIIIVWGDTPKDRAARYEPPDGKVYHGVGWNYRNSVPNYLQMMPEDQQPLLFQTMSAIPGTRPLTVEKVLQGLRHEWQDPERQFVEYGVHFHKSQDEPYDSLFAFTDEMDHYIDTLAIAMKQHGKPFFLRIGGEMNGDWNKYTPYIFPQAYRKLVIELRSRGVNNFATVWCYEPAAEADFADSTRDGWKWYPGDDVVDWFGLDVFPARDFDPDEPDTARNGQLSPKGKSELFLKWAREKGFPVYINETTSHSENIIPDDEDPGLAEGEKIWNHWFEPFFRFMENHPEIKAFNYINLDWTPIDKWSHWGDCRLEINTYIRDKWIEKLDEPHFIHAGYQIGNDPSPVFETDTDDSDGIGLFPNPASGVLFLVNNEETGIEEIAIFDSYGCKILVKNKLSRKKRIKIDIRALNSGMYLLKAKAGQESFSAVFIVNK